MECDARSQEGLGASLVQESGSQFARQTHMSVDTYHAERGDSPPPRGPAGVAAVGPPRFKVPRAARAVGCRAPALRGRDQRPCATTTRSGPVRHLFGDAGARANRIRRECRARVISHPLNSPGECHGERAVVARSAPRQGQRDRAHGTTRSVARAHLFREGLGEHGARAALGDGRGR